VPRNRITGIVRGERAITADTALRLARFFDMSAEFWLGLQMDYDLETTRASIGDRLEQEVSRAPLEARRPTPIPTPVACSPQRARRRSRALAARPVAC
jgi:plasmid maintenance system antidote protein VapI